MILERFMNKKNKIKRIAAYNKGCKDTNIIRDKKEVILKDKYKSELKKKNEKIKELYDVIFKKDLYVDKIRNELPILKNQLEQIECFIEIERDENQKEMGRRLIKVHETKKQIKKISKVANDIALNMLILTDKSNIN